jgi:hypothetical protein
MSSIKNESGANVKNDGKANRKHEYGELYKQWVKKTRKQVSAGGDEDGNDYDDNDNTVSFGDDAKDPNANKTKTSEGGKGKFDGKGKAICALRKSSDHTLHPANRAKRADDWGRDSGSYNYKALGDSKHLPAYIQFACRG